MISSMYVYVYDLSLWHIRSPEPMADVIINILIWEGQGSGTGTLYLNETATTDRNLDGVNPLTRFTLFFSWTQFKIYFYSLLWFIRITTLSVEKSIFLCLLLSAVFTRFIDNYRLVCLFQNLVLLPSPASKESTSRFYKIFSITNPPDR